LASPNQSEALRNADGFAKPQRGRLLWLCQIKAKQFGEVKPLCREALPAKQLGFANALRFSSPQSGWCQSL
jgi:hypothetical protein